MGRARTRGNLVKISLMVEPKCQLAEEKTRDQNKTTRYYALTFLRFQLNKIFSSSIQQTWTKRQTGLLFVHIVGTSASEGFLPH